MPTSSDAVSSRRDSEPAYSGSVVAVAEPASSATRAGSTVTAQSVASAAAAAKPSQATRQA